MARPVRTPFLSTAGHPGCRRGFTLIEVLVALFVFAVAMTALIQAGSHRAQNLAYLRDRTLASWIAADRITALRLEPDTVATGSRDGEVEMAGRTWFWRAEVETTADKTVQHVDVAVRDDEAAAPLARVQGFLAVADVRQGSGAQQVTPAQP